MFGAWGALIAWLSLIPSPPKIETPLLSWDKLQHGGAYALFTLLGFLALADTIPDRRRRARTAVFLTLLFGGLLEAAQGLFTATRTAEATDLLADAAGAALAYLAVSRRQRPEGR